MEFAKTRYTDVQDSVIQKLVQRVSKRNTGAPYLYSIELKNIRRYKDARISFDFPVTALIGTNGGGKSTVLGAAGLIYSSVAPRTFFAKSGKYDSSMQDWSLTYEHWEKEKRSVTRTARYRQARWGRDAIDRPVVLLGVSRTLPATERKRLTAAISNSFQGAEERPISEGAKTHIESILGRDMSSYITVDIDGAGQEDRQFFASQPERGPGYSEFHFGAGEASIIRIAQHIEEAEDGALILIEEIENGLHPVATRLLVDYLIKAAERKRIQVIFTTHSDSAIAGLPDDAVWACVDGTLSQGKLQVAALRALTGEVRVRAAFFVEDSFAELMLEKAVRNYCQRHESVSPQGIGIYPVGGADAVVQHVKQHNRNPSIQGGGGRKSAFPALAVLDGDCRDKDRFRGLDGTYFLPGEVPEAYVADEVFGRVNEFAKRLMLKLSIPFTYSEEDFIRDIQSVKFTCSDPHMLFHKIGEKFDFISESVVKRAFLDIWCEGNPDVVDELVSPLARYFPGGSVSSGMDSI